MDGIKKDLREKIFENERWMELAKDCVQWRTSILEILELRVR
jgi:hypothetical protein